MADTTPHLYQHKQVNVQNFNELLAYIVDKVLIDRNVKQTSYFPSRHKIRRIFQIYLQQQSRDSSEDINYEYMLCYIMIKQHRLQYRQQLSYMNPLIAQLQKSQKSEVAGTAKQMNSKNYIIHESNLLNLLESLVGKRKQLNEYQRKELGRTEDRELRKNNKNELIYDFNEIEQDGNSVLFKNIDFS